MESNPDSLPSLAIPKAWGRVRIRIYPGYVKYDRCSSDTNVINQSSYVIVIGLSRFNSFNPKTRNQTKKQHNTEQTTATCNARISCTTSYIYIYTYRYTTKSMSELRRHNRHGPHAHENQVQIRKTNVF